MSTASLQRFVDAQRDVYAQVLTELRAGTKRSHWMWFIFPQIAGLGMSAISQRFSIVSIDEAAAYLAHPLLGPRLLECSDLVLQARAKSADEIFGSVDAMKFRSCMTLFREAADAPLIFQEALSAFYGGQADMATLTKLKRD